MREFREVVAVAYKKKNPVGAPPKYKTAAEMQEKIDTYFADCEGELLQDENGPVRDKYGNEIYLHRRPPTVTGLALALGFTSRQSLLDYQGKKEFLDTITRAKARCEQYSEERLFDRDGNNGAQFSLRFNFGWDKAQEKPEEKTVIPNANENRLFELLAPQFLPTWQKIMRGEADEALEKGGRGSTKSSFCSIGILKLLQLHPNANAVCVRKVGNTLRTSVYAQMQWAADQLEPGLWKCTVSPMEMTNRNTGQKILFFGLDDPGKIKSIKLPHGYIGILWFEELDQYDGPEQIRNVEQSCLRGGDFSFTFKSFNPPASPRNWANRYALEVRDRKIVQHSDYTMVPQEWLGRRFLDDAEDLKQRNLIAYNHEYLGEVTGCGKEIFTNIKAEHIDPGKFERKLHGVDWGWYPDPYAYNCMSYDAARKTLYIYDEITVRRTRNEDTFRMLQERKVMANPDTERLTADSAENKSCGDYTEWGITCLPAIKGPNSVGQGIKWLQSISIVIDPVKCPDTLKEFTEYEYDADKNGDPLPGYPDHDNHHIDAVRYACESIWREPGA